MSTNYENGRTYFKEGIIFLKRAKILLKNNDYSGSIHSSQNAAEFFIKSMFLIQGKKLRKNHEMETDFNEIVETLKKVDSSVIPITLFEKIELIAKKFQGMHTKSMYGVNGKTASQSYKKEDAIVYYQLANELSLLVLIIDIVYSGHANILPSESDEFFDKNIEKRKKK